MANAYLVLCVDVVSFSTVGLMVKHCLLPIYIKVECVFVSFFPYPFYAQLYTCGIQTHLIQCVGMQGVI